MNTDSVARDLAAFLEALARHLQSHPHLAYVNISRCSGAVDLQVHTYANWGEPADVTALIAWADSLPQHTITARLLDDLAYVSLTAALEGFPVRVWSTVPGLAAVLDDPSALTLNQLRAFAGISPSCDAPTAGGVRYVECPECEGSGRCADGCCDCFECAGNGDVVAEDTEPDASPDLAHAGENSR